MSRPAHLVNHGRARQHQLSPRMVDVLVLSAAGLTDADIASELLVSENTVKSHLKRIYVQLGVPNRTAAVAQAYELGVFRTREQRAAFAPSSRGAAA